MVSGWARRHKVRQMVRVEHSLYNSSESQVVGAVDDYASDDQRINELNSYIVVLAIYTQTTR